MSVLEKIKAHKFKLMTAAPIMLTAVASHAEAPAWTDSIKTELGNVTTGVTSNILPAVIALAVAIAGVVIARALIKKFLHS